jgi:arabinofuranosyltransferase
VAHSLYFNFICDDAYITFVYSRNLAEHHAPVFNADGANPVEGYTNFLWMVLLGLGLKLRLPPELSAHLLSMAFAIGTLGLVTYLMALIRGKSSLWDFFPAVLLASSSAYACWTSGGLETQLFTFLVTLGIVLYLQERLVGTGAVLALAAMTRPEGNLILAVLAATYLVVNLWAQKRWKPRRCELLGGASFLALYLPYFLWRWHYYGYPFPNTFYVKVGEAAFPDFSRRVLESGLFYVGQWVQQANILFSLPFVLYGIGRHRRFGALALCLSLVYLGYTIKIGGDFMGLQRFIMPLFVLVAVLTSLGLSSAVEKWCPPAARGLVGSLAALLVVLSHGWTQAHLSQAAMEPWHHPGVAAGAVRGIDTPGYLKLYAHDRGLVGKALAPHMRQDDFSIVGGAGVQPYYARMKAVDVFGLISEEIAHQVRPNNPRPGHSKWGPASQLIEWYHPSLIFHCYAIHHQPQAYQLCDEASYFMNNGYEPITIHVPGMREFGTYYTFLKHRGRPWP